MIENNKQIDNITIELPFPPSVDLINLISKKSPGKIPARSPNAFIIYRKIFVETARQNGYNLSMTEISTMASKRWASESDEVKAKYKIIASDALAIRNDVFPKHGKRKRKDRWNLVTFDQPSSEEINERRKARRKALKKKSAKTSLPKSNSLSSPDNPENSMNDYSAQSLTSTMEAPPLDVSRVMLDEMELAARYAEPEVLSDEQNHVHTAMFSDHTVVYSDANATIFPNEINSIFPREQNQMDAVNSAITSNEQFHIDHTYNFPIIAPLTDDFLSQFLIANDVCVTRTPNFEQYASSISSTDDILQSPSSTPYISDIYVHASPSINMMSFL
ncbi:17950_t:CDS:1 [Acaulospora morrowiae]|uniref:17950_t:CDS:1 n=1 Tax=Acaulospora morrowiae TaxID=94023 RepID=A0A9N9AGE0_9GLOM|nr:17950_t:CDS:1 [Acaulospora morrowiae]